jgi:hypothetical protein
VAKWVEEIQLWVQSDPQWVETDTILSTQWAECGWAELGWIEGDTVCPSPTPIVPPRGNYDSGGGTGFEHQRSRISLAPKSYIEPYKRERRILRQEKSILEFVVRFTTDYL